MSAIVFVLAGVLACAMLLVVGWRYYRRRARPVSVKRLSFIQPFPHKLTAEECAAIEHYLHHSQPLAGTPLTPRSENIYSVTHAITRYGLAPAAPHKMALLSRQHRKSFAGAMRTIHRRREPC